MRGAGGPCEPRWAAYSRGVSDLQCAARIILITPAGLGDGSGLAADLFGERVQDVYAADDVPDARPVASLAAGLEVSCHTAYGDLRNGTDALQDIADRHRGETVVVVRPGAATEPMLLLVDADGSSLHPLHEGV